MELVETPRVGIAVFVFNDENEFVMLKRQGSHGAGTWSIPGGRMEFGEHWFATAIRELAEEIGVFPHDLEWLTITNDIMYDQHWVTIWLTATCGNQPPQNLEPAKCTELGWFDFNRLPEPLFGPWEQLFKTKEFKEWRQ